MSKKYLSSIFFLVFYFESFGQNVDDRIIRIPVIFHVVYSDSSLDNGINDNSRNIGNSTQYLPTEKLTSELKDLHDDFMLLNNDTSEVLPYYKPIIGNPKIEFFLADTVLQIGGEKGIIRIHDSKNYLSEISTTSKIINPQKYYNVYIGRIRGSSGSTNLPIDSFFHPDDAVHLDFLWVGLHYRLLTHETGHWLGLLHIYGGNGGAKGNRYSCTIGDSIPDTPPQKKSTDGGICTECPPPYGTAIDQSCDKNIPSNYNNYMDYSGCRKMFTLGQSQYMREIVKKYRPIMWRPIQ